MKSIRRSRAARGRRWRKYFSFSIIELLLVTAIIFVVLALLIPTVNTARESARQAMCASNLHQYGVAFRLYQNEHDGMYPNPTNAFSINWQAYLCGALTAGGFGSKNYLPTNWLVYHSGTGARRIKGDFLCPTVVETYKIPLDGGHTNWGYCLNHTRVGISWQTDTSSGNSPWFREDLIGADLDELYKNNPGRSGVMCCGNGQSLSANNDWDAFTGNLTMSNPDWPIIPIHFNSVNVLYMDGHVDAFQLISGVSGTGLHDDFNAMWYRQIPDTSPYNPWMNKQ